MRTGALTVSAAVYLYLGGVEAAAKAGQLAFQEAPDETIWLVGGLTVTGVGLLVAVVGWITTHMVSRTNAAQTDDIGSIKTEVSAIKKSVEKQGSKLDGLIAEVGEVKVSVSYLKGRGAAERDSRPTGGGAL